MESVGAWPVQLRTTMNIYALELARLPNTSLELLLRLIKTLVRDTPAKAGDHLVIGPARDALLEVIARVDAGLTARLLAQNPAIETSRVEFDRAVDQLWVMLRRELELQEAYRNPGLAALPADEQADAELEQLRERAERASRVWTRLFAANGTTFTRAKFLAQAEQMGALLRLLDRDGLRADLESVVGAPTLNLILRCQKHYEHMTSAQLSNPRGGTNLNELRQELRWAGVRYVNAVQTLYDPALPETGEQVYAALRSIVTLRELLSRPGGEQLLERGEGDADTFDLDALDEALEADELEEDEVGEEALAS